MATLGTTMSKAPVGILGGGQLAQMLVEASHSLGLGAVSILDETEGARASSPAALAGGEVESPAEFFRRARVVIFENEFVDCDRLACEAGPAVRFFPELAVIRRLQDKLLQKCVLHELGIATSPFERAETVLANEPEVRTWLEGLRQTRFPRGVVLKWARFGYDGKGVCVLRPGEDVARALAFCAQAQGRGVEIFAEEWVDFRRELAIVACRGIGGEFVAYPLVESRSQNGICHWVLGPITDEVLTHKAVEAARRLSERVGLVGAFALEFFEAKDGRLLVNEIAPRVHNTGHYTQDAAVTSQFENHWRAVLGLPLGSVRTPAAFAMLNLLGPSDLAFDLKPGWNPESAPELFVHWYGKTAVRPGRKLGHVNARSRNSDELSELVKRLEVWHSRWENGLRGMEKQ